MLNLAQRRILTRIRCPGVQKGVRGNVFIDTLFVRQSVMFVVLCIREQYQQFREMKEHVESDIDTVAPLFTIQRTLSLHQVGLSPAARAAKFRKRSANGSTPCI